MSLEVSEMFPISSQKKPAAPKYALTPLEQDNTIRVTRDNGKGRTRTCECDTAAISVRRLAGMRNCTPLRGFS